MPATCTASCPSSSGQRDPRELTTAEAKRVLDELRDLQVLYINIGGSEPMVRRDFFELVEYSIGRGTGVKFSTNSSSSSRKPQSAGACASYGSYDACQGGCMAAKFFTGLPLDGPDPNVSEAKERTRCPASRASRCRGRP